MLRYDHSANRQRETSAGTVPGSRVRGVRIKNPAQRVLRYPYTGVTDIDTVAVRYAVDGLSPLSARPNRRPERTPFPEERIATNVHGPIRRREFAGIVQEADQDLLNLIRVSVEIAFARE